MSSQLKDIWALSRGKEDNEPKCCQQLTDVKENFPMIVDNKQTHGFKHIVMKVERKLPSPLHNLNSALYFWLFKIGFIKSCKQENGKFF